MAFWEGNGKLSLRKGEEPGRDGVYGTKDPIMLAWFKIQIAMAHEFLRHRSLAIRPHHTSMITADPKQFRLFLYASVLGLVMFAILHNVFEAVASKAASAGALQILLQGFGVTTFFLAVLICPPAIIVGAVGSVVMFTPTG